MAGQRFLPDVDRTRRSAGWTFITIALPLLAWLGFRAISAGRVNGTTVFFFLAGGALMAIGSRLAPATLFIRPAGKRPRGRRPR